MIRPDGEGISPLLWDQGYYATGVDDLDAGLAALSRTSHDRHPEWKRRPGPSAPSRTQANAQVTTSRSLTLGVTEGNDRVLGWPVS